MDNVDITFSGSRTYRATEIVADLRNIVEAVYQPMRMVGYWDVRSTDHLCPHSAMRKLCPHTLPKDDPRYVDYLVTVRRDFNAALHVHFPHAQVHFYLV